jgi:hypothetical protein
MEKAFFIGYREGEKAFYLSSTNWKDEEEEVCTYIDIFSSFWKEKNVEFEKSLSKDLNLYWLSGKKFTFGTIIIAFKHGNHTLLRTIPTSSINTSRSIHLFWT